ncbi:MAG: type III-B CRISPR module-associated protein Cmr5 [Bacteroidota bacterium]
MTTIRHLEGGRAACAYEYALAANQLDSSIAKAYKSYVKKIPMLIKTNGLGATFAFVLSKSNENPKKKDYAYTLIHQQTWDWLQQGHKRYLLDNKKGADLPSVLIQLHSANYRAVTVEVLSLFSWLRRFAEGLIEGEAEE